jgi:hypothetical protein
LANDTKRDYTIFTSEKVEEIKKQIERLTEEICSNKPRAEIKALRLERARLVKSVNNYYYRKSKGEKNYSTSLAMQMFGKRRRDLTEEELREYNKLLQRESRKRRKESK